MFLFIKVKILFKKVNEFIEVVIVFIFFDKVLQLFGVDNQVEIVDLCKMEFFFFYVSFVDLFLDFDVVSFVSVVYSSLVVVQVDKCGGEFGLVGDVVVKDFGCFVQIFFVCFVIRFFDVSNVGVVEEVFEFRKLVKVSVVESESGVDWWFMQSFLCYMQVFDKVFVFVSVGCDFNNFLVVFGIFGFDI